MGLSAIFIYLQQPLAHKLRLEVNVERKTSFLLFLKKA